MLLIPCPHCGPRDESEFAYGGDATIERPADPQSLSDTDWAGFLYIRENPKGPHTEYWFHRQGCRRWFKARRDTLTHAIAWTAPPTDEPAP